MYEEKEPMTLPFAADQQEARIQCILYAAIFGVITVFLLWLMNHYGYTAARMAPIMVFYSAVVLGTWLPMVLRCVMKLHLEPEAVRITAFGITLRRYPLGKIRFLSAMACSGKNHTGDRSQILLCAYTFEELAKEGGWQREGRKSADECARQYLNRYANAYYVRELNLTRKVLWLDWSPERIRLIRWYYPDAQWMDFTQNRIYDKQMND